MHMLTKGNILLNHSKHVLAVDGCVFLLLPPVDDSHGYRQHAAILRTSSSREYETPSSDAMINVQSDAGRSTFDLRPPNSRLNWQSSGEPWWILPPQYLTASRSTRIFGKPEADVLRAEQVFCVRYCALEYSQLFAHGTWAVCKQGEPILAAHLYQSLAKVGVINGVLLDENLDEVSTSADITDKHHVLFTWSAHGPFPLRFLLNSSLRLKRPDMLEHSHALCRKLTSESDEKHLIPAFCSVSDRQKTVLRTSSLNRSPCLKYDEQSSNRLEPRHRTARCHTTDMQDV